MPLTTNFLEVTINLSVNTASRQTNHDIKITSHLDENSTGLYHITICVYRR